ncbi:hypothetical protein T12_9648 [Trichinella patagoniensis]|uniref:Uncharacterized protein n=1 Tax=Trichinella patagoniensis TaxID=990121 RepID=A0A0V0ZL13_9BILA|nr:hypothetical protein T12_9648 [Trichinella patagoniensis]
MSRSFALRISTSFTRASAFMVIGFEPGTHVKSSGYTFVYCVTSLLQSSSKDQNVSDKTAVAYELVDCNFCSAITHSSLPTWPPLLGNLPKVTVTRIQV